MANTIKMLSKISMAMRNLGTLTNYTMTKRFIQTSIHYGTNYDKETLVAPRPHLISDNTEEFLDSASLQGALKNCNVPAQIFSIVQANQRQMSAKDAICALDALVNTEKGGSRRTTKMCSNGEFLTLCEILKKKIRNVEPGDGITALKAMIFFNVPTTSIIVQMLLQVLRHSVNDLPLQKISFLDFLLLKCEDTPLVGALRIALPIVYENNILAKLDRENIHSIKNALTYLSRKSKNTDIFNVIFHALRNCKQPMDPLLTKSVLWALCELSCYTDELPGILNYVQDKLARNIASLDRRTVISLLQLISVKIRAREKYYYNEGFVDACASAVISEDYGFADAITVLERLIVIGHTQIALLDYIAGKCFEDPSLLETCSPSSIAILVDGFATADYKPIFWDPIEESVTSERFLEAITNDYPLSKLAINLLSLDCYCPKLLSRMFEKCGEKYVYQRSEKGRTLLLYQTLTTLYPQYTGRLPINDVSELFRKTFKFYSFPLVASLECALGGPSYVLSNIRSKLGHIIDHAIVMRKGGFPIAINNEPSPVNDEYPIIQLDDIKPPADSQVILILFVPARAYSINTQRMKGTWSLQLKTLEAHSGYTIIPIRSTMWMSFMETEKIPYLMQAIRLKCDELSISANS